MNYFKNKNNEIFAYDNEQVKQGYGKNLTPITEAEKDEILAPTEEELQAQAITEWKANRQALVDAIVVTYNGIEYQGDEKSQDRMSRGINALPDDSTTMTWVAYDNSTIELSKVDLKAILLLAGTEQSRVWTEGRP